MVSTGSCAAVRICPNPTGNLIGGNQKSHCAISPAKYVVRDDGSGGRYTGRSSATRALKVRIEYGHSIRSAITVAGIVGRASSSSRIRGSTASTTDPVLWRRYAGGPSAANAAFTVFFEHPNTRAITLIGIRSARCNRRISAQSSTLNTHFLLTSTKGQHLGGGQFSTAAKGSVFTCRRQSRSRCRFAQQVRAGPED